MTQTYIAHHLRPQPCSGTGFAVRDTRPATAVGGVRDVAARSLTDGAHRC